MLFSGIIVNKSSIIKDKNNIFFQCTRNRECMHLEGFLKVCLFLSLLHHLRNKHSTTLLNYNNR